MWTLYIYSDNDCAGLAGRDHRSGYGHEIRIIGHGSTRMDTDLKYHKLTEHIIKIFYKVYNKLGYGFLEKVFDNSKK